jgi:glycosyltransferase involved in cell wall biosynthesis
MEMEALNPIKISVVIPTYKRPVLLTRCIEALRQQDFPREQFEIIVVSDGVDKLTEQTIEGIVGKTNLMLHLLMLPKKAGPAAARNMGWRKASANLIAFTDDDCMPGSKWLSSIWEAFSKNDLPEIAFTGRTIVPLPAVPTDYERNIAHLEKAEFITANCACTKQALLKVGGLDERFTMAWREDSDLQFKLMLRDVPIHNVKNAIVTHPVRKAPWGVSLKEEKKGVFNALLFKKYPTLYKQKIQRTPPWHYYFILFCLILFLSGSILDSPTIRIVGFTGWILSTIWFTVKRLSSTSRSFTHVAEMIFTSLLIPYLSLYYRLYGALKYKTPLIP